MVQRELYHPLDPSLHLLNQPEAVGCPKCSISALRFATSNVRHAARWKKHRKEKRSTAQQPKAQLMQGSSCLIEKKRYLRNNTDSEILHVLIGTLKCRERVKCNIAQSVPRGRRDLPGHPFVAPEVACGAVYCTVHRSSPVLCFPKTVSALCRIRHRLSLR
jgi:hypothetical protein